MLLQDWFIVMGMGGLFVLLGVVGIIWGRREETGYYDSQFTRPDVKEFLERWPQHPQPLALKIGGWIAVTVGLVMLAMGGVFWLGA